MASKRKIKVNPVQAETPAEAAPAQAAVAAPVTITVTDKVAKLGGTRKLCYDAIKAFHGKTLADFAAAVQADPTIFPLPPKGSVKGRVRFLVRSGLITLS